MNIKRPEIHLADPQKALQVDETIWGMLDLHRGVALMDPESPLLPELRFRLRELTNNYTQRLGDPLAAKLLVENGYVESKEEVAKIRTGEFKEISTDESLQIVGPYVIGIVGLIQSGKTSVGGYMTEKYKSAHYPFIGGLFAFAWAMGLDPPGMSRMELVRQVNDIIKPYLGHDRFARTVLHRARRKLQFEQLDAVTCDGFRSLPEAKIVLSQPKGILVAVEAADEERYARQWANPEKKAQRIRGFSNFMNNQSNWERDHMMAPVIALIEEKALNNSLDDDGVFLRQQIAERFDKILPTRPWISLEF